MKIKKIVCSLLLISTMSSVYSIKSNAQYNNLNNDATNVNNIIIKNEDFNYKNVDEYVGPRSIVKYGKNSIAVSESMPHYRSSKFNIFIFDNISFEMVKNINLEGSLQYLIETDGGYLVFVYKDTGLHLYKISESGNIIWDKQILDSIYEPIVSIKIFNNNIIVVMETEIIKLSNNGSFVSRLNIKDLINLNNNDIYIHDIFDTGSNYNILYSVFNLDLLKSNTIETCLMNISYDGVYEDMNCLSSEIVYTTAIQINENEYYIAGMDKDIYDYIRLIKFNSEGTILKEGIVNDRMYSFFEKNKNDIFSVGAKIESVSDTSSTASGVLSQMDNNLNIIDDYAINKETLKNDSLGDNYSILVNSGKFIQDRMFVGSLQIHNLDNYTAETIFFSVDLNEVDAVNAIDKAISNPTKENIESARQLINNLKESDKKDELQNKLNDISPNDVTFEKKTASANVDIYIKSENMLLINLSTNSISFDDYSGVDEIEKPNAVEISINSSLPYQLNAYLLDEMYNSNKSKKIDMDRLQIKDNNDTQYKEFTAINNKLVLKDDCSAGNGIKHKINLKLKGGDAYPADIYKTIIKFEAEQK